MDPEVDDGPSFSDDEGGPSGGAGGAAAVQSVTVLAKKVLDYVASVEGRRPVSFNELQEAVKVDVAEATLAESLSQNERLLVRPDVNTIQYVPLLQLTNINEMRALIKRTPEGVTTLDLKDSYSTALADMQKLVAAGDCIFIQNRDRMLPDVVFPRDNPLLLPLPAKGAAAPGQTTLYVSKDVRRHLYRGDLVQIGGHMARVSMRAQRGERRRADGAAEIRPREAKRKTGGERTSAAHLTPHELVKKGWSYERPYLEKQVPLQDPFVGPPACGTTAQPLLRFGMSGCFRTAWKELSSKSHEMVGFRIPQGHQQLRLLGSKQLGLRFGRTTADTFHTNTNLDTRGRSVVRQAGRRRKRLIVQTDLTNSANSHLAGTAAGAAIHRAGLQLAKQEAQLANRQRGGAPANKRAR